MSSLQVYTSQGKQYARIVESYRDQVTKKPKTKILKNLGRVDKLEEKEPGIINRLKKECVASAEMNRQLKEEAKRRDIEKLLNEQAMEESKEGYPVQNYGVKIYEKIWKDLRLDQFFNYRQKKDSRINFNLEAVVKMLVMSRLLNPASKRRSYLEWEQFSGEKEGIKLEQVYRSLPFLTQEKENLEKHINEALGKQMERKLSVAFYDVTTYYFESTEADTLKNFGYSKDNKVNQVQVVMGLLIDEAGIPVSYELFPGNTSDFKTLIPVMKELKERYGIHKMILTADRGLNSKENLVWLKQAGFDYVFAFKIRSTTKTLKETILDEQGYQSTADGFRWKLCEINQNVKGTELQDQLLITWSAKRAAKDRSDRERLIQKSMKLIESKSQLQSEMKKGGKKYVQLNLFENQVITFDQQQLEIDEQFDGYYGIQTSDKNLSPDAIIRAYGGLWKIEESFRVLKTNFESRPIFVWTEASIRGHFVICYLALVLERYLEYLLSRNNLVLSTEKIQDALRSANVTILAPKENTQKKIGKNTYFLKNQPNNDFTAILSALSLQDIPSCGTLGKFILV